MNNKNEINSYPIYTQISLVEQITILNKLHCDYKAQSTPNISYTRMNWVFIKLTP